MSLIGKDDDIQALDQCIQAISFLNYCGIIEQGGDEGSGKRELDRTEMEVRDSALSCVLVYLEKQFLQIPCPIKKKTRKHSARTTSRGRSRKTSQ